MLHAPPSWISPSAILPAVVSYPPSDAVGLPPPPVRQSRLMTALRHPQRSAALLAILIGFASVFSAVLAWRASLASIDASRHESLAVQESARRNQLERLSEGVVAQDERFVLFFQEHALAAREFEAQAAALRGSDPATADILDLEAQAHRALARATQPFFLGAGGIYLGDDGTVPYDRAFVLRNLREGDPELRELRTQHTIKLAQRADDHSLNLIALAAIMVAALLLLTVAQVSRTRLLVRQVFFVVGGVLVLIGALGFLIVEVFA